MATRTATRIDVPARGPVEVWEWTGLLNSDDGSWVILPAGSDRSVHAYGTFGAGGTVTIQGTNETGTPANPVALRDNFGTALTLQTGAAALKGVHEPVYKIRPAITGGDGTTALTVRLVALG